MIENTIDWKIHRRLREATTGIIYAMPARGNNKPYTQFELYVQLMCGTMNRRSKLDEGWDYIIPNKHTNGTHAKEIYDIRRN